MLLINFFLNLLFIYLLFENIYKYLVVDNNYKVFKQIKILECLNYIFIKIIKA